MFGLILAATQTARQLSSGFQIIMNMKPATLLIFQVSGEVPFMH